MVETGIIYNEDCIETLSRIDDNSIDMTLTSPPYDKLRKYNGYSFDFETIAKLLFQKTKHGGTVIWVVGDSTIKGSETGTSFRQALFFKDIGFNIHDTMIYRKTNYTPLTHKRYEQEWEYMFCFSKGKPNTFNPIMIPCKYAGQQSWGEPNMYKDDSGKKTRVKQVTISDEKIKGNIFEYRVGSTETGKIDHPAMFPKKLAIDMVLSWSNPGDLVYDPFLGSGTTAIVAIENGRQWIGSEISEEYCELARRRTADAYASLVK